LCAWRWGRPGPDRVVIVSGFGERAEWYRNLLADPACFVSVGRLQRVPAQARFMTSAEASAPLDRYQRAHPGAWDRLRQVIEKAAGHPVDQLPMVELLLDLAPQELTVLCQVTAAEVAARSWSSVA
jgi:deazaflavin-dependent oxidoreductase (nitroreductase family)